MATKTTKAPVKRSAQTSTKASVNSKKLTASRAFWLRTRFIFYVVLITAALVAISVGLMTYQNTNSGTAAGNGAGALFLQSLDGHGSHKAGDTVTVTLYEDSGTQSVNALQAGVRYPSEKLEFVSADTGAAFPQEAATDAGTTGIVRVARSIKPGTASVKGAKPVVTLTFKVLVDSSDPFELSIDDAASLLVRSSDNQSILGSSASNKFEL